MAAVYRWVVRLDSQIDVYLVHDGLEGDTISQNGGHVQMRSMNRISNWCLQDGLEGMVIYKMAAIYRWEVRILRIDSQMDVYMMVCRGWWFTKWRPWTDEK
jgi:hypothetical protein